jgi:pimeloyl-ACP methyl ester carboxylesterase
MQPGTGEYTEIDGIRTYFVHKGRGPNLVLLHGQAPGASLHVMWDPTIDCFADAGFSVYAFDQVGFGRTDNDPTDFTRDRRVRHARAFLDTMALKRCALWGQSDGSNVACRMALQDPRVSRLVVMACSTLSPRPPTETERGAAEVSEERGGYSPSLDSARAYLTRSLKRKAAITDALVSEFHEMSSGKNHDAFKKRRELRNVPIYDELHALTVPVLMLWGRNDAGGAIRGMLLQEKIPGAELHIFDNCGHWVQVDQAERVNSLVRGFLSEG